MPRPLLTIDLGAIAANWRALDARSGGAETAAAVKADGYGCGTAEVAGALERAGCRTFFVATLEEGLALRAASDAAIFVLNGIANGEEAKAAKAATLRPCLNHPGQLEAWRAIDAAFALQLDSGMSRLGFQPSEVERLAEHGAPLTGCELVFSHLACADDPQALENAQQLRQFADLSQKLRPLAPGARRSLAATGGTLLGSEFQFDLVRCGIGLYGGLPFAGAHPVVSLSAPILQIREIAPGDFVGYSATWRAERPSRIATLPLGYADGFHRALSSRATVYIDAAPAPLTGRVSMDLVTIDVTDHPRAQVGTPVEILGPNQRIDDLAEAAGTIGYEILTSLGRRYERIYP